MLLEIERVAEGRLRVRGEVDISSASRLEEAIERELEPPPDELVLEVEELTFVDSTGIQLLVQTTRRLGDRRLVLEHPREPIVRVLELVGFNLIRNVKIVRGSMGREEGAGEP